MDDSMKAKQLEEIIQFYSNHPSKNSQDIIVEMLREIQEVNGCITPALMRCAADTAEVNLSVIQVLVRHYPSLKEAPYQHEVIICTGKACSDKGTGELLKFLNQELLIQKNGISKDGKVCLKTRSCLKHCRTAPNLLVDGQLYSNINKIELLDLLRT